MFSAQPSIAALAIASHLCGGAPGPVDPQPTLHRGSAPTALLATATAPSQPTLKELVEQEGASFREFGPSAARITIIHVRNFHLTGTQSPLAPSAEKFWGVQQEALELIGKSLVRYQIAGAYPEGVTDRSYELYRERFAEVVQKARGNEEQPLKQLLADAGDALQAHGAIAGAIVRWNLPVKCGESFELHQRASEALRIGAAKADEIVLTAREDELIRRIASDFPRGSATVLTNFGAEHRLEDNVARWNTAHAESQVRVIELTPAAVLRIRGESHCIDPSAKSPSSIEPSCAK